MKKYDLSIHFTIKGQTMTEIDSKIDNWLEANKDILDCSEKEEGEPTTVLHHCFLPREIVEAKGFSTDVVDSLDEIASNQVRWYSVHEDLGMSRLLMLQNLKRLNGVALFVGEVKEGVKDEYLLASQLGVKCIIIP
jgi:hypothetical protein